MQSIVAIDPKHELRPGTPAVRTDFERTLQRPQTVPALPLTSPIELPFAKHDHPAPSSLAVHVRRYAGDVLESIRDLRVSSVREYLQAEAFAGRLAVKRPPAKAFVHWVKAVLRASRR